ncbi:pseudouridine-5'-phosphatase [Anabrus simplex]|uniref:pseudouridine-5'-phosphatase n=1 Tax=Anabrus simplex TaxID=316456 RepID=UPI0034DCE7EC
MANFKPVTHVIFDMDGLLIDSEGAYDKVFSQIIEQFGKKYTWDVRSKVMGTKEDVSAQIVVQELQLPISAEEFLVQQFEIQKTVLPTVPLLPGAERLVRHLHKHKIPIAVATSSGEESVKLKLKNHQELFSLFDHIVMGSSDPEVKNGKPAPDIFLICASRFPDKPDPEKVLVFEDAINGVKAGRAAGMQVVMVPDPHVPEDKRKEATLVLNSLEEFQPELFGLPPF